jgi:hypothetical protein
MTTISRAQWRARSAPTAEPLDASQVIGLAFHWPAMSKPLYGVRAVSAALRSWQAYHMDTHGWRDIAYQVAVDQDGNRYILRGLDGQSGANGSEDVNRRYGAVLLVLAPGEQPTDAMIREVHAVVRDHRRLFAGSKLLVGHNEVRPEGTACPGPIVQALIDEGAFESGPTPAELLRADLNAAMKATKAALAKTGRRPRMRYQLERARQALSKARKINRGE